MNGNEVIKKLRPQFFLHESLSWVLGLMVIAYYFFDMPSWYKILALVLVGAWFGLLFSTSRFVHKNFHCPHCNASNLNYVDAIMRYQYGFSKKESKLICPDCKEKWEIDMKEHKSKSAIFGKIVVIFGVLIFALMFALKLKLMQAV